MIAAVDTSTCPDCDVVSSENFGGEGLCWPCWGKRDSAANPTRVSDAGGPPHHDEVSRDRPGLRFLTPAELRAETPPEPDWLLEGYIAPGVLTIGPAGKPKVGKSTLTFAIVRAIRSDAGTFLGRRVRQTAVVYLSEEGGSTLLPKLPADDPGLHILTRENAYPRPAWPELVSAATDRARTVGADLLVIDTFPYWAAMAAEREKDAGAIQSAMEPLLWATQQGLAVMVPAHTRKGGGEDGDALRGSSALAGAGDVILELERPSGQNPAPRQRVLAALSRYPKTPGVLVVEHDAGTDAWSVVGQGDDRRDMRAVADRAALLSALPTDSPGLTRQELEDEIGSPHQQFAPTLSRLIEEGHAKRDGAGKKGDPYRYRILRNPPAQNPRTTSSTEAQLSAAHPFRDAAESTTADSAQHPALRTNGSLGSGDLERAEQLLRGHPDLDASA